MFKMKEVCINIFWIWRERERDRDRESQILWERERERERARDLKNIIFVQQFWFNVVVSTYNNSYILLL